MTHKTTPEEWRAIPILPCVSIEATLSFWESLGFHITYKQTRPYQYGAVARAGCDLHFGRVKGMDSSNNYYSGSLVIVPDAQTLYQEFTAHLKNSLGKVPHTGIPRISRMKPNTTRFTLTDVAGNSIIFITNGAADQDTWEQADNRQQTPLQKAIATAIRFRDYKEDHQAAAATLDAALKKAGTAAPHDLAEALLIRIDLATCCGDELKAAACRTQLQQLPLEPDVLQRLSQRHHSE